MRKGDYQKAIKLNTIPAIEGIGRSNNQHRLKTGSASNPKLSDFLKGYVSLVKQLESIQSERQAHQLDINEFDIEITTGLAGMDDNEIILAL